MLNRRNFIGSALVSLAGFAILPGAGRIWKAEQNFRYIKVGIDYSIHTPLMIDGGGLWTVFNKFETVLAKVGPQGELIFEAPEFASSIECIHLKGIRIPTPLSCVDKKIPLTTCFSVTDILNGKITPENLVDELTKS